MDNKRQFILNLVASLVAFAANLGIGFLLTPFIVQRIGAEAYGFVGLANTMVNYAALATLALNSVAGRFITVAYHRGDKKTADKYFTSTLSSNLFIIAILAVVSVPLIWNLERVINISPHLVGDVKLLFTFIVVNFLLSTISTVFTVATFIKNKLYLGSVANIAAVVVKVIVLILLFGTLPAMVWYVGLGTCAATLITFVANYVFTKRLVPELRFVRHGFSWPAIREMLAAGIWNCVIKLQQILQDGLSLLVANLMISPYLMGLLSIAQLVPTTMSSLMGTITSLFSPQQTKYYAQGRIDYLIRELKSAMRICGLFVNLIFVVLLVVGEDFIKLWQPGQDARMINILMQLTMGGFLLSGVATTLQGVPLLVNKLREYSIGWLICGAISFASMVAGVYAFPSNGIYAVAAVPQIVGFIANLTFVPIYAARCLKLSRFAFYPVYLQYIAATAIAAGVCYALRDLMNFEINSWITLIAACAICSIVVIATDMVFLLGSRERSILVNTIKEKIHRK
ncbi:lipopolysaccharide biosynthesis protein [Bifidobacterium olomucense]|nr:hypothetical protein [Bifidobacterium sp. DSM 109959]